MANLDEYRDPRLEMNALAALLHNSDAAVSYLPRLFPKCFTDDNLRRLFVLSRRFVLRSGTAPTRETLRVELSVLYPKDSEIVSSILGMHDQLAAMPIAAPVSFLVDNLCELARVRELLVSVNSVISLLDDGKPTDALRKYEEDALALQVSDPNVFVSRGEVFEDFEKRKALIADMRVHPEKYRGVLTGIAELDKVTNGLWKGELGFCFGKTGVGKSFFLLQVAYYAYLANLRVLVIPIEMPLIQWQRRFDARISKVAYEHFKWATLTESEEAQWERSILQSRDSHWQEGARVFVTHIPIGCPVAMIRAELERYLQQNASVDLLVIDYADQLAPPRQLYSQQGELTAIFEGLKALATSYDIPIWTASQSTSASYSKEQLSVENVGYAKGKAHVSDLVVGIARNDADQLAHRLFFSIAKYRDGVYNRTIMCRPNFALAMIDGTV